jgi:hypothetical protein
VVPRSTGKAIVSAFSQFLQVLGQKITADSAVVCFLVRRHDGWYVVVCEGGGGGVRSWSWSDFDEIRIDLKSSASGSLGRNSARRDFSRSPRHRTLGSSPHFLLEGFRWKRPCSLPMASAVKVAINLRCSKLLSHQSRGGLRFSNRSPGSSTSSPEKIHRRTLESTAVVHQPDGITCNAVVYSWRKVVILLE